MAEFIEQRKKHHQLPDRKRIQKSARKHSSQNLNTEAYRGVIAKTNWNDKVINPGIIRLDYKDIPTIEVANTENAVIDHLSKGHHDTTVKVFYLMSQHRRASDIEESLLIPFKNLVQKSRCILDLEAGWDEGEAEKIHEQLYEVSTKIMLDYFNAFLLKYKIVPPNPKINAVPDGTIDFEWYNEGARLLINFRMEDDRVKAYFYGDLHNNNLPIKGNVPTDQVYNHLLEWMRNL